MTRKLNIGGEQSLPGWEILNIKPGPYVDHLGDGKDLSQFEDQTFDELYASHVVEHFDYNGPLLEALKQWHRVLKPGGKLYISVPDMNILCQLFLKYKELADKERFFVMRMMFGGHIDRHDYHYVGLDYNILAHFLTQAGFQKIKRVQNLGIFEDTSVLNFKGISINLNVIVS